MKNIIVAVDIAKEEEKLVRQGIEIARKFDAKLWIIHASAPDPDFVGYEAGPQSEREARAETLRKEKRILETMAGLAEKEGVEASGLLIQGVTEELILEETHKLQADLLIIGHRKLGLFQRMIKGNITRGILENIDIPTLVVPLD